MNEQKGGHSMGSPPYSRSDESTFAICRIAAPVREQVEQHLRQAITSGHFRPGERLIERELCALLGVSRTSLREALRQLETDGLVVNIPHKGLVVATMTGEEAREIFQVRAALEGLAGRLCAEQMTAPLAAALQASMQQVEAAHQSGNLAALVSAKDKFYQVLLAGSGNRMAGILLQSLHDRIAFLRAITLVQPGRATHSVAEMRRIVEAILAQDQEAAARACIDHVEQGAATAAQVLEQWEQRPLPMGEVEPHQGERSTAGKEQVTR
jgi:DNA-binding GntR family transcriptional regulator